MGASIVWLLVWASVGRAEDLGTHLRAAIRLNRERRPIYAQATDGASRRISRQLIWSERWALVLSGLVDIPAHRYQRAGVPLLERELVSMSLAPPLVLPDPAPPLLSDYTPLPTEALVRDLSAAVSSGDLERVAASARLWLAEGADAPAQGCLTRHLLESVVAIAALGPAHVEASAAAGLRDPQPLLERLLRQHIRLLPRAALLDIQAAPLQAAGVPLLCQDVPPILSTLGLDAPVPHAGGQAAPDR